MTGSGRPRPRVTGKPNPGVSGKGESPIGNTARMVPKPLASSRAQAAEQLLKKYGKSRRHLKTGEFTYSFDGCSGQGSETDSD